MIAFFGTKIGIILNNTKDTHKSTYDAKRLRNYSLYNQTPKEKQRGVKDSRRRPQVQGLPLQSNPSYLPRSIFYACRTLLGIYTHCEEGSIFRNLIKVKTTVLRHAPMSRRIRLHPLLNPSVSLPESNLMSTSSVSPFRPWEFTILYATPIPTLLERSLRL